MMPFIYMTLSVLCWSLFPLMSVWGIEQISIFDYILWAYVVGFITSCIVYFLLPARQKAQLPKLSRINRKIFAEIFVAGFCALMSFTCLLKSFSYISRASATITAEVWLIITIYIAPILLKKGWEKISRRDQLFSLLAVAGVAFLLVPEALSPQFNQPLFHLFLPLIGGVFMAAASTIKPRAAPYLENKDYPMASLFRIQIVFIGATILMALPLALLWPDKHSVYNAASLMPVIFTGIVIHTLANGLYTLAMLRTTKSNILVLWSFKPGLAVLWLWLAGQTGITGMTVVGAIFIITASLMITVKADKSLSYAATMIGILLCGVYVYFVSGLGMEDYYQAISVPLFFYAILVAFMMDRLKKSDELEEQLAVETMNYIDEHASKIGAATGTLTEHVLDIVSTGDMAQVNAHYKAVRNHPGKTLAGIYNHLDHLALSKVRGTNFSEMYVIFIVGVLTILSSIVYRPDNLIADGFAIVVPLSVIFVFFTVLDLSNNRSQFFLERNKGGEVSLSQEVTTDLSGERIIAAILILAILTAFVALLWVKHGGHF